MKNPILHFTSSVVTVTGERTHEKKRRILHSDSLVSISNLPEKFARNGSGKFFSTLLVVNRFFNRFFHGTNIFLKNSCG